MRRECLPASSPLSHEKPKLLLLLFSVLYTIPYFVSRIRTWEKKHNYGLLTFEPVEQSYAFHFIY